MSTIRRFGVDRWGFRAWPPEGQTQWPVRFASGALVSRAAKEGGRRAPKAFAVLAPSAGRWGAFVDLEDEGGGAAAPPPPAPGPVGPTAGEPASGGNAMVDAPVGAEVRKRGAEEALDCTAPSQGDAVAMQDTAAAGSGGPTPGLAQGGPAAPQTIEVDSFFATVDCGGAGDCLFLSVAQALAAATGWPSLSEAEGQPGGAAQAALRSDAAKEVRENPERLKLPKSLQQVRWPGLEL